MPWQRWLRVFTPHSLGDWVCRGYKHSGAERAQLQQLVDMGGHNPALAWLHY